MGVLTRLAWVIGCASYRDLILQRRSVVRNDGAGTVTACANSMRVLTLLANSTEAIVLVGLPCCRYLRYSMHISAFSPDTQLPFATYRRQRSDKRGFLRGEPETFATLAQFYFSERARAISEEVRLEIANLPSTAEARKAAGRLPANPSWLDHRLDIVRCGLWNQFRQMPSLAQGLLDGTVTTGSARSLGTGWSQRNRGDQRWLQIVLKTAKRFTSGESMSLLTTGDPDVFNPFLFSARLTSLLDKSSASPSQIIISCRAGVDAMAEMWAMERYIPVLHCRIRPRPGARVSDPHLDAMIAAASHAFVITKGSDQTVSRVLEKLKAATVATRVVRIKDNGQPAVSR